MILGQGRAGHGQLPQIIEMFALHETLAAFERLRMFGEDEFATADGDHARGGGDLDGLPGVGRRHRVAAALIMHQAFPGDDAADGLARVIGCHGGIRCERGLFLFLEQLRGHRFGGAVEPGVGRVFQPVPGLGVEIVDRVEGTPGQEVVLEVIDHAFDLALGAGPIRPVGFGRKAVMTTEVQEALVPFSRAEADLFHVVVENGGGPAAEELEGGLVTLDEHGQLHRSGEADEQQARKRQHHEEGVNVNRLARGRRKRAAERPVRLGLPARRRLVTQGDPAGTFTGHLQCAQEPAQRGQGTAVTHALDLLEEPHRRELILLVTAGQILFEGIELGVSWRGFELQGMFTAQHAADGVSGVAGQLGDGPDGLAFFVES